MYLYAGVVSGTKILVPGPTLAYIYKLCIYMRESYRVPKFWYPDQLSHIYINYVSICGSHIGYQNYVRQKHPTGQGLVSVHEVSCWAGSQLLGRLLAAGQAVSSWAGGQLLGTVHQQNVCYLQSVYYIGKLSVGSKIILLLIGGLPMYI